MDKALVETLESLVRKLAEETIEPLGDQTVVAKRNIIALIPVLMLIVLGSSHAAGCSEQQIVMESDWLHRQQMTSKHIRQMYIAGVKYRRVRYTSFLPRTDLERLLDRTSNG